MSTLTKRQKAIAERIAELLAEKGWTQRDLAYRTKLKDSYITRVLQAEANLTLKSIDTLEHGLGKPLIVIP